MTFIREPGTGLTTTVQSRWLGDLPGEQGQTTVQLADGSSYVIPSGPAGSAPWAREASLIAKAYQQAGDTASAYAWQVEFSRRTVAWNAIQAGEDFDAIINSGSWMDGPAKILGGIGSTLASLPWLLLAGLAVVALGFHKKQLRISR